MTATARVDDPWTSWAAARSITGLRQKQAAVLWFLDHNDAMSLSQLVRRYKDSRMEPEQSESGIRTRAKELQDLGLVVAEGSRTNSNGRQERLLHARLDPSLF